MKTNPCHSEIAASMLEYMVLAMCVALVSWAGVASMTPQNSFEAALEGLNQEVGAAGSGGDSEGGDPTPPPSASPTPVPTDPPPTPSPPPSGGCFGAGTAISMADGTQKPIELLEIGDMVLGWDIEANTQVKVKVTDTMSGKTHGHYLINGHTRVTSEHPFFVDGRWVKVSDLKVGDILQSVTGQKVKLDSIRFIDSELKHFNITVDRVHNYYANGVLVHNKKDTEVNQGTMG